MARVDVEVGVRASRFKRGLDEMRSMATRWSNSLARISSRAMVSAGSAISAGLRGATALATDVSKQLIEIADQAKKLGETPENFQKIAAAAEKNASSLDEFVKGLVKVNEVALDAADGEKKAMEMMATLGIESEAFLQQNMANQVITLASAFERLSESGDPTLRFMELLGEKGANMLPLLRQGGQAVADLFNATEVKSAADIERLSQGDEGIKSLKKNTGNLFAGAFAKGASALNAVGLIDDVPVAKEDLEKRKKAIARSKVQSPEELAKMQEELAELRTKEADVDFQNTVAKEKNKGQKAFLLAGKQNELVTKSRELAGQGKNKEAAEMRIQAKEMEMDVFGAEQDYRKSLEKGGLTTVASSLQEVGGGGAALTLGSSDAVMKDQAMDVKEIRLILGKLVTGKLEGASLTPQKMEKPFKETR